MSLMQIVGSSFTNLPDIHQLLQQSQPAHLVRSHVSDPTRGSSDVDDTSRNFKEKSFIKPQSMGEYTREPGEKSPHCHKGIVEADENSNGNVQVMHLKIPLKNCSSSSVLTFHSLQNTLNIINKIRHL